MYQTIRTEITDGILTIALNRPDALNAFTYEMSGELLDCYEKANQNDDVCVIIVTGTGHAFCAGMDLSTGKDTFRTNESAQEFRDIGGKVSLRVFELSKPIIAAINGPAVGIGLTMTLPMDIRIVKKDTKIGFVFGRVGIGPEAASGWMLPRIVGIGKALEWTLTGKYIHTDEALETGLVQHVVEDPYEKAYEIAREIMEYTSATSNHFTRKLLWKMLGCRHPYESHLIESQFLHWASRNADAEEGVQAFLEKRKPNFPLKVSDMPSFFEK
ncbi:enoyl-CoA hydratase-related protein [Oceanobacillus saliphilus]|uniref:enoyl-CoA hydratase-related protein n=1 Tax=Oceanobacillus saliphilus TaxID=2925834 RepID=UPI00201E4F09|nr:enoyl-CoA hydratase-related protein [Oceanobacillus saliphilus]